jgi:DNA-binding GntR family transcriptional regulator
MSTSGLIDIPALDSTAAEQAYQRVKELIVTLALPPGTTVREAELQQLLEVGRTPLREGLHRLAYEGMLHIYPRRAIVVAKLGVSEVRQVFEVRLALEPAAAGLAAQRVSPEDIEALHVIAAQLANRRDEVDSGQFLHIDQALHRAIARYTRNALMERAIAHVQTLNLWLWHSYFAARGTRQVDLFSHEAIVEALENRESLAAEAAMREHILASKEQLMSGL